MGDRISFWSRFFKKGLKLFYFLNGEGEHWFMLGLERVIELEFGLKGN